MGSPLIYTSMNVPTVITSPSVNCLQWSEDGQVFFTSKNAVYIMTPEHGIIFDIDSVIKSSVNDNVEERPSVGWFRTMIPFDKTDASRWTDHSQDWSALSLGSMDISVWSIALSPSHLTRHAGCILAVLSSNMDLSLWIANRNALKGEWKKVSSITGILLESFFKNESLPRTANTIAAQILCIDWSSQPDFGRSPALELDSSFLVCGNRAGSLLFIRYENDDTIKLENTLTVADQWILQVAFSKWRLTQPMTCVALVAYSTPDGSIGIVRVRQTLQTTTEHSPLGLGYSAHPTFEQLEVAICDTRKGALTALKWIDIPGRPPVLVYNRPGTVHFWSDASSVPPSVFSTSTSALSWSGLRSLQLKTQKHSIGSSFLQQVSGIQYIHEKDAMILCLLDGSFHAVYGIAGISHSEPILNYSWPDAITGTTTTAGQATLNTGNQTLSLRSELLSTTVRDVFERVEHTAGISFTDVMRTSGMVCYDDGIGTLMWLHEVTRPADFNYKHDAKHNSVLTVARIWNVENVDIINKLSQVLRDFNVDACLNVGLSPLSRLRFVFFHLRQYSDLSHLHSRLVEILKLTDYELEGSERGDHTLGIHLNTWSGQDDERMQDNVDLNDFHVRKDLRNSLKRHLFGYSQMLSLRMRLSVADYAWKLCCYNPEEQAFYSNVAQGLLMAISHRNLRILIRHLIAVAGAFTLVDVPFVLRLVVQSSLPSSPANLLAEGKQLSALAERIVPLDKHGKHLHERCPACGVEVLLQDIISATCQNGHTWSRCSITTFILSTTHVRTCIGCTRKAFLPLSGLEESGGLREFLPAAVRNSRFVEELLEAVHRCLFCGNAFVSVL
ncbi:transcription factor IIIC subunit delta N-term-domain-containing protein [Lentinula raphanica]|nr:transcription factor IIIC subunit delta N-term-domain-containing protein [Lentinula raphanica]